MSQTKLGLEHLLDASKAGGASALASVTELAPAGGETALVAPAKYLAGKNPTYVFENRFVDGTPVKTVLIDARTSEANRVEESLALAIEEGQPVLSAMPKIRLTYPGACPDGSDLVETDLTLPHRAFDAHIRLGFIPGSDKKSIINCESYVAARDASPASAGGILEVSPITVILGGWDSTRSARQARFASCLTGEIIGVLSDQEADPTNLVTRRSGARVDPVCPSFTFGKDAGAEMAKRIGVSVKAEGKEVKGSSLLVGAIPPSTKNDALDGISVSRIIRSRVLSFAALRTLRFGGTAGADQAIRALLAAVALNGAVRADAELQLRANAHLVEKAAPVTTLYGRYGRAIDIAPLEVEAADELLRVAYEYAHDAAGIDWHGQTLEVQGDPAVIAGAKYDSTEE